LRALPALAVARLPLGSAASVQGLRLGSATYRFGRIARLSALFQSRPKGDLTVPARNPEG